MSQVKVRRCTLAAAIAAALPQLVAAQQSAPEVVEEIVVTGSYIRRASQFDSPSPLVVVERADIESTGTMEVGRLIEDLTINTGSQNNPDAFTQNLTTGTNNINLRGLGVASTLVLINGRRQTPSSVATDRGENFVDTASLPPMIAMQRVEIVKDGATALYGSEAVAGVVNFITRSDFDGFELQLGAQSITEHDQRDLELGFLYGVGNDRTHFLAALSHLDRDPLTTAERRLSTTADDLSQAGNPGSFLVPTRPAHPVYAAIWAPAFDSNSNTIADFIEPTLGLPAVPGAQPPVFADQDCAAIAATDPKVIPTFQATFPTPIGDVPLGLCQFDFGEFWSIVPREERTAAYVELTHQLTDRLQGRIEFHVADNDAFRNNSPSFPFAAFPLVSATHPDNPFGTDVQYIGRLIGAGGMPIESRHSSDTRRLAGSFTGGGDIWVWETGVQYSENEFYVTAPDVLIDRFANAMSGLGGPDCNPATGAPGVAPCFYFNPFGSSLTGTGTPNPPQLMSHLLGFMEIDSRAELLTVEGFASRLLWDLPGGTAAIAVGAQHRAEEIAYAYDEDANAENYQFLIGNPDFSNDRNINALFAELALPLSATVNLQLAARHEDYGDIDSTDPKATLLWRPTDSLSLRASLGTSFRAPSLFQSFGTQTTLTELVDPEVGTPQFFPVRTQPDPTGEPLRPEEADVFNAGVSWFATDGLELSLDYWSFDYTDVIIEQNPQAILNAAAGGDPAVADQIVRDAGSGLLVRVDAFYDNASALETDGFDMRVAYDVPLAGPSGLRVGAEGTYVASYDINDPQAGTIAGAGRRNFANFATAVPEWRVNGFAHWTRGDHAVDVYLRYIDAYVDDQIALGEGPEAFQTIDSHVTADVRYAYTFRGDFGPTLSVGAINLFDEDPPHVTTNGGYDSKVHDPRGRMLYARATFRF